MSHVVLESRLSGASDCLQLLQLDFRAAYFEMRVTKLPTEVELS